MKKYYKKKDFIYGVADLFLFLFAFRFLNKNNTFLLFYVGVSFVLCFLHRSLRLSIECMLLLLYGLFYYFIRKYWGMEGSMTGFITLAVGAPLMYIAGQQFLHFADDKEKYYNKVLWIVSLGMFLFAMLSFLKNGVIYNYEPGRDLRQVPDLWVGNASLWQATNINGYCVFAITVSIVALLQKARGVKALFSVVLLLSSVYLSLVTAARTNLFLVVLVLTCYIFLILILKNKRIWYIRRNNAIKGYIMLMAGIILASIIMLNFEKVVIYLPMEAFIERMSNRTLSIADDGRWEMWTQVIEKIPTHFWGNNTSVYAAHNIYLDVAREAGVIPMVLLLTFTVMVISTTIRIMWNKYLSLQFRLLNSVLVFSLLFSFLIEPVMNAKPFIFISFCLVCGMQYEISKINYGRCN